MEGSFICISANSRIEENSHFDLSICNKRAHISLTYLWVIDHSHAFGEFEELEEINHFYEFVKLLDLLLNALQKVSANIGRYYLKSVSSLQRVGVFDMPNSY